MLEAARRFATLVVLAHLVLLAAVVGVVGYASYHIYAGARAQAVDEAARRQALLARQTATGVESYYRSIMADLVLLERTDEPGTQPAATTAPVTAPAAAAPATGPATGTGAPREGRAGGGPLFSRGPASRPGRGRDRPFLDGRGRIDMTALRGRAIPVNPAMTGIMWRMLQHRATMLFVYDPQPPAGEGPAGPAGPAQPRPAFGAVVPQLTFPARAAEAARQIARENAEFLNAIAKEPAVSTLLAAPDFGGDGHLIAVPATGGGQFGDRVLVAFVPLHTIKTEFFDPLNNEGNVSAALLDKSGTAMIALDEKLAHHNVVSELKDPKLVPYAERHILGGVPGTWTAWDDTAFDEMTLPPRVIASEPVDVPGRKWTVLVMAPLSDVEATVRPIFRSALGWAVFLSVSITLIFASTAYQIIRARVRWERARREMLTRELEQARGIQLAWLPDGKVPPPGLQVAATNIPASHISGDFYNWFTVPAGPGQAQKVAVCIGDVTGHGMSAAFLMATTQLLVRNTMARVRDPGACLTDVNRQLCTQAFRGQFVTLLLLLIDPAARTVELATAGHPGPLIADGDGTRDGVGFRPLPVDPQFLLGVVEDAEYPTQRFALAPGATVLLYTDGLVEAAPPDGPQFGTDRLMTTLAGGFPSLQAVLDALVAAVQQHTHRAELDDDVTMVALKLDGQTR